MKLAIGQMVLGVLVCCSPWIALLIAHWLVFVVLGLAVLGYGIAQFQKAEGLKGAKPL